MCIQLAQSPWDVWRLLFSLLHLLYFISNCSLHSKCTEHSCMKYETFTLVMLNNNVFSSSFQGCFPLSSFCHLVLCTHTANIQTFAGEIL